MPVNTVTISGNLTKDPEIRMTKNSQTPVLNFSVAVNERFKTKTGEWENRPNYFDCVVFGTRANGLAPYLYKGLKVCVSGSLRQNTWEQDGQKRSRIEIIVNDLDFISQRNNGGNGSGGYQPNTRPAPVQQQAYNQQPAPMPNYQQPAPQPMPAPQPSPQSNGYAQQYQDDIPF